MPLMIQHSYQEIGLLFKESCKGARRGTDRDGMKRNVLSVNQLIEEILVLFLLVDNLLQCRRQLLSFGQFRWVEWGCGVFAGLWG